MVDILNRLCMPTELEGHTLICRVPSFRDDVEGRADLAEEVMRVYGYSHIVGTPMTGQVVRGRLLPERRMTDKVKSLLIAQGAQEIVTYSFISGRAADQLGAGPRRSPAAGRHPAQPPGGGILHHAHPATFQYADRAVHQPQPENSRRPASLRRASCSCPVPCR